MKNIYNVITAQKHLLNQVMLKITKEFTLEISRINVSVVTKDSVKLRASDNMKELTQGKNHFNVDIVRKDLE